MGNGCTTILLRGWVSIMLSSLACFSSVESPRAENLEEPRKMVNCFAHHPGRRSDGMTHRCAVF